MWKLSWRLIVVSFRTFLRTFSVVAALGLGDVLVAPVATATPVLVRDGNGDSVFNGNGLPSPEVVSVNVSGSDKSVYAAPFALQYSTTAGSTWIDFLTYCLEPDETLGASGTATAGNLVDSLSSTQEYSTAASRISRLYATYFADSLTSGTKAAAFQVALWEVSFDTGSDLSAGAFKLNTTGSIASQAVLYLKPANWLATGSVGVILRAGNQDLLVPLSEPTSLGLLGAGLLGLGLARQYRRAARQRGARCRQAA
jgi:hypothetical protein